MDLELVKDVALVTMLLVAIGCALEMCWCVRRVTAASIRSLNTQAAYWQSGGDRELRESDRGEPS